MILGRRFSFALWGSLLLFKFVTLSSPPAYASVDTCVPVLKLDLAVRQECGNIAALTPGNDTRVNLLLLLFDRHGLPSKPLPPITKPVLDWGEIRDIFSPAAKADAGGFADGEGSRCRSNGPGAQAFEAAVKAAANLSSDEQTALLAARANIKPDCKSASAASGAAEDWVRNAKSEIGKSFAIYLRGAEAFYAGRFDDAAKDFESLRGSADPWLADTAGYMVARTQVNLMQANAFDNYGTFKGSDSVDQEAAKRAEASLESYLKDHPGGLYVQSAEGLQRRVEWLAGWGEKLAGRYAALLAQPAPARNMDDVSLAEEIDNKLLPTLTPAMTRDPILLAILDLRGMRKAADNNTIAAMSGADIEAQRDAFVGSAPELYDFLKLAQSFYVDGAYASVLKTLPDDTRRRDGNSLWFSRQFLRGEALEAAGDRNTRGFWKELYPGAKRPLEQPVVELALALHEERHGELEDVFAPGSLVTNSMMRNILLEHVAGPALLRAQAQNPSISQRERKIALLTLLYKELTRGRYADFLADVQGVPADASVSGPVAPEPEGNGEPPLGLFKRGDSGGGIGCPPLLTTAAQLERDPSSLRDRLCVAEFVRVNQMDQNPLDTPPPKDELGSTPSLFPGPPYARAATYLAIIEAKKALPADRAYALYRSVRCYEPSGFNQCGGDDVPKAKRKAWFNELKGEYPATRWAKDLRYWW